MSEFVLYENPANKAARLENENAKLRLENYQLRVENAQHRGDVTPIEMAQPTRIAGTTAEGASQAGACRVQIGRRATPGRPAIPALQQAQPNAEQTSGPNTTFQLFKPGQAVPALANRAAPQRPDIAPRAPVAPAAQQDDTEQRFAMMELGTPNEKQG